MKPDKRVERQSAPPPLILNRTRAMGSDNKISRSPTPPEPDDDGEEWPVHGIVGEDIDVFGIPRYSITYYSSTALNSKLNPLCSVTR